MKQTVLSRTELSMANTDSSHTQSGMPFSLWISTVFCHWIHWCNKNIFLEEYVLSLFSNIYYRMGRIQLLVLYHFFSLILVWWCIHRCLFLPCMNTFYEIGCSFRHPLPTTELLEPFSQTSWVQYHLSEVNSVGALCWTIIFLAFQHSFCIYNFSI